MNVSELTPRLPLTDVLNINNTWIRGSDKDLGDLSELKASIKAKGLQLPILVEPDFRVLKGARRVLALNQLGYNEVPVVVIRDWDTLRTHMADVHKAEAEGWPTLRLVTSAGWEDLFVLKRFVEAVAPIYAPAKNHNMVTKARISRKTGIRQSAGISSTFELHLGEMLGIAPARVGVCRRILKGIDEAYAVSSAAGDRARAHVLDYIANGGRLWTLKDVILDLAKGADTSLNTRRVVRRRQPEKIVVVADEHKAREQVDVVANIIRVLSDMGVLVSELETLNPAIELDVLVKLQEGRKAALTSIGRLRSLLDNAIKAKESE